MASKKQKARARGVAAEFEFETTTAASLDEMDVILARACEATATKLNGTIHKGPRQAGGDGTSLTMLEMKGPANVMSWMTFGIESSPADGGGTHVSLEVGDFLFQKGGMMSKPKISGAKTMRRFVDMVSAELGAVAHG